MPWGWECRAKMMKQVPPKPVEHRAEPLGSVPTPAPNQYKQPKILGGPGFNKIKKGPAYPFGIKPTLVLPKPSTTKDARLFNIQGMVNKGGSTRITHGLVTPHIEPILEGTKTPGPGVYKPTPDSRIKKPPAYSLQPSAKPPFQSEDMWTPPANMYCPAVQGKAEPSYTLGYPVRTIKLAKVPGPGEHDPNYKYVKKTKPSYSFGAPFRNLKPMKSPPPNNYCEKKFMYPLRRNPAPSFGIRHSTYMGKERFYTKTSKLELAKVTF